MARKAFNIYLTDEQKEAARKCGDKTGLTLSPYISQVIEYVCVQRNLSLHDLITLLDGKKK